MGFLRKLFDDIPPEINYVELLDRCVKHLRSGLFARIFLQYKNEYKHDKPTLVAEAIMNYIACEKPHNDERKLYLQNNKSFVEQAAKKLIRNRPEIKNAVIMLYIASICLIFQRSGNVSSEHVISLTGRAIDLSVQIPTQNDWGDFANMCSTVADFTDKYRIETDKIWSSVMSKQVK